MSLEMEPLDFHLPTRVVFGWGAVARAGELAAPLGKRALLVTMRDLPHGERVAELLRAGGIELEVWDGAEPDPSVEGIDAAAPMVREGGFDFLVAVGGGSAMDTAKALCLLAGNAGAAWEFTIEAGDDRRMGGPETLPLLAVPTTAGTGSEVTLVAVMTNRALRRKAPIRDPRVYPAVALVDPELTVSMPPLLTAATGFDALTHAYERYFGGRLFGLVHLLTITAMRSVVQHLETAVREPANRGARTALSWAATQAGIALCPPGGEAALHIFGLPQGAVAGVSHGESLATVMRVITRESLRRMPERRAEFAVIMGLAPGAADVAILDAVEAWLRRVGLKTRMGEHGITEAQIPDLMAAVSRERLAKVFGPDFGDDDIRRLYLESL